MVKPATPCLPLSLHPFFLSVGLFLSISTEPLSTLYPHSCPFLTMVRHGDSVNKERERGKEWNENFDPEKVCSQRFLFWMSPASQRFLYIWERLSWAFSTTHIFLGIKWKENWIEGEKEGSWEGHENDIFKGVGNVFALKKEGRKEPFCWRNRNIERDIHYF